MPNLLVLASLGQWRHHTQKPIRSSQIASKHYVLIQISTRPFNCELSKLLPRDASGNIQLRRHNFVIYSSQRIPCRQVYHAETSLERRAGNVGHDHTSTDGRVLGLSGSSPRERIAYLGSFMRGCSAPTCGSPSTTSSPAPQIHSSRSACASASESTNVPRAGLTSTACFFILRRKPALMTCCVASPPGASTNNTSLSRASSSSPTRRTDRSAWRAASAASSSWSRGEHGFEAEMQ